MTGAENLSLTSDRYGTGSPELADSYLPKKFGTGIEKERKL